jgi:hypothetical protein
MNQRDAHGDEEQSASHLQNQSYQAPRLFFLDFSLVVRGGREKLLLQ